MPQRKIGWEDQLLETATRPFEDKGYHSTSMQGLADAPGRQEGSLYCDIDSKEELLRHLSGRATPYPAFQIDEIYANGLPPREKHHHHGYCFAL